jgi:cyclophilin family peptidyl-prolyl cis-trans isomerase
MDSMGPDKNGSVFFITVDAVPEIDGQYVVFGEVIEGMEVVDRINSSTIEEDETPRIPIVISECGQL